MLMGMGMLDCVVAVALCRWVGWGNVGYLCWIHCRVFLFWILNILKAGWLLWVGIRGGLMGVNLFFSVSNCIAILRFLRPYM